MEKVSKGQRVTITCHGLTVTGTVISADHEMRYHKDRVEVIGYLLEIRTDEGHVHYWKSLIDGGSIVIHPELPTQEFEVRYRYRTDDAQSFYWEFAETFTYRCQTAEQARIFCQVLLMSEAEVAEIRWNWNGSYQGYYFEK